jgi:SAM-dependent methyltransferase
MNELSAPGGHPALPATTTTADEREELFGVHIPELQLSASDYEQGMTAADLKPGELYLELGSGHGRGLVIAARDFEARAHGVEYLEDAIERSWRAVDRANVRELVEIERGDVRRARFAQADVVHMHLGPAFHDVLAERLEELLTPNARVIAAGWKVPGWQALAEAGAAWDGGYVYRPADPKLQVTWGEPEELADGSGIVAVDVHADLAALEVRVTPTGDDAPRAVVSADHAGRGQRVYVAYELPGEGVAPELALWGRSRNGRFTQRGAAFTA